MVTQIIEFYEYQVTQCDPETGEGGHFVHYINTFLKLKAEASGYPSWVRCSDDEDRYVQNVFQSEGIMLDKEALQLNSAKRGLAKHCLNSLWCKLTERNNRRKSKMITDSHELYRFLATPGIEVTQLLFVSDDVVWLNWCFIDDENIPSLP